MTRLFLPVILVLACGVAFAKLPAVGDEAKAKAAEAAARTAWSAKVDAYQLCKAQDGTAVHYYRTAKSSGKETRPAAQLPACVEVAAFVYPPVAAASAPAAAVAAPAGAKPPAAAVAAKKP